MTMYDPRASVAQSMMKQKPWATQLTNKQPGALPMQAGVGMPPQGAWAQGATQGAAGNPAPPGLGGGLPPGLGGAMPMGGIGAQPPPMVPATPPPVTPAPPPMAALGQPATQPNTMPGMSGWNPAATSGTGDWGGSSGGIGQMGGQPLEALQSSGSPWLQQRGFGPGVNN